MKNKQKPEILFLIQLPPPIHGASLMNEYLVNSDRIKSYFKLDVLDLDFVSKVSEIGEITTGKIIKMINISFSLMKMLLKKKYDIVYFTLSPVGGAFYRDLLFVFILKIFRTKIIYHLHGKGISLQSNNLFKKSLYKYAFKNTSVICLSKMLECDIDEVHNGPVYFVSNGIPNHINKIVKKSGKNLKEIVYLSALKRSKGVLILLEALKILSERNVEFSAKIIGGSTNDLTVEELRQFVLNSGLNGKVNVMGPIYGDDKFVELGTSGIFCFPTYYKNECFPLSILEAMKVGLVPVSTDNGAIPEIIDHNVNGLITNMNDPIDLAEKLLTLIENEKKLLMMSANAKQKFNELYTIDMFEEKMIQTFKTALDE